MFLCLFNRRVHAFRFDDEKNITETWSCKVAFVMSEDLAMDRREGRLIDTECDVEPWLLDPRNLFNQRVMNGVACRDLRDTIRKKVDVVSEA